MKVREWMGECFLFCFLFCLKMHVFGCIDSIHVSSLFPPRFGQTISSTATSNHWPLVAVSHQMTVRDAASLPLEQLDGLLSRIRGS